MSEPNLQAAPPLEWVHAEQALEESLTELGRHIDEHFNGLFAEINQELITTFTDHIQSAHAAHQKAINDAGLDLDKEDNTLVVGEALWRSLGAYRDSTTEGVIKPLLDALQSLDIGFKLSKTLGAYKEKLGLASMQLPSEIIRPEPAALYAPLHEDRTLVRIQKANVRALRSAALSTLRVANRVRRKTGSLINHAPPRSQRIPVLHLGQYHIQVRLEKLLNELHETFAQLLSSPVAQLESAITRWTHEVLETEWKLDQPEYHIDNALIPDIASESPPELALSALKAAGELRDLLGKITLSPDAAKGRTGVAISSAWDAFEEDIKASGSFMAVERKLPLHTTKTAKQTESRFASWISWHRKVVARLQLNIEQVNIARRLEEIEKNYVSELSIQVIKPVLAVSNESAVAVRNLSIEAEKKYGALNGKALSSATQELLDQALRTIEGGFIGHLLRTRYGKIAADVAERSAGDVVALIRALPDTIEVNALQETNVIDPAPDLRRVPLRRVAENALDALLIERIRSSAVSLIEVIRGIESASSDIPSIVRFNLESAIDELSLEESTSLAAAKELTLGGLSRSADAIEADTEKLGEALLAVTSTVSDACAKGWLDLHERIGLEGRIQEQFADALTRIRGESREAVSTTSSLASKWWKQLLRTLRLGRSRAEELVRLGQTALGVADETEIETRETIDALIEMDALLAGFPLVYKRLFSFRPVTDPALFVGRKADLERVRKHLVQWKKGRTNALILIGSYGGGHTSFLNILRSEVLHNVNSHYIDISERWNTEEEFAAKVVELLGLDSSLTSLAEIRDSLLARPRPEVPIVVTVEHLEHLLLRTVGGMNLVERVLTFMSRTDARIVWIVTVTDYGWQLIEKTEATAASLVVRHTLPAPNREALEALILNRHRRSGIPLVFAEPSEPSALLRRKLRKAKDVDAKQGILQSNFFDRLAQITGPNIMLALFYWLRSIQLDEEKQLFTVKPPRMLSFGFLSQFGLNHAFSLKAFLEHASLTLTEHSAIFQMSEEESLEIFEALGNRLLIQPMDGQLPSSRIQFTTIEDNARYRIRPLLIQPVTQYLRGKNIVY